MPPNWWPRNPLLSTERAAGFFHHTPTHLSGAVDENATAKFGQKFQADLRDKGEVNGGGGGILPFSGYSKCSKQKLRKEE